MDVAYAAKTIDIDGLYQNNHRAAKCCQFTIATGCVLLVNTDGNERYGHN